MSNKRIAVTGYGILSTLGHGPEENATALRAGRSGIVSTRPLWAEHRFRSQVSGNVPVDALRKQFDRKQNRFLSDAALLAAVATQEAIEHAGLSTEEVEAPSTGIVMGTGAGASVMDVQFMCERFKSRGAAKVGAFHVPLIMGSSLTANIGSLFRIHGHSYSITSACSTSAHAIMIGMDLIRSGRQKRMFVGGAEDINLLSAAAFDGMNALSSAFNDQPHRASRPLDRDRDGFVISGGSGILVLEDLELAQSRGATIHAVVAGAAASCDGDDMVVPSGLGAQRAMRDAIADAGIAASEIEYINLHGTSTPAGDLTELEAIQQVFGEGVPPFSSTKSMTGHALGAAGSQEAIFCLLMMQDRFLAPNINLDHPEPAVADQPVVRETRSADIRYALSNSFGFGGTNCSLVLSSEF